MAENAQEITECLQRIDRDPEAESRLAVLLNDRMRRIARKLLWSGRRSPMWDTTGLADDVLMKLLRGHKREWQSREQFFAEATVLMRRQLIDYARGEFLSQKRGEGSVAVSIDAYPDSRELSSLLTRHNPHSVLVVDELAEKLRAAHPLAFEVFDHHFFGQYALSEISEDILRVSYDTVKDRWRVAKLFLARALGEETQ